jgi:hypothetical protein
MSERFASPERDVDGIPYHESAVEPLLIIKVDDMDISGTESTMDNIKDSINVDKRLKIEKIYLTVTFEEAMHLAGGFGKYMDILTMKREIPMVRLNLSRSQHYHKWHILLRLTLS